MFVALLIGKPYINALRRLGLGQHIREEGPKTHRQKAGTPTMGGGIILTGLAVTVLAMGMGRGEVGWAFLVTLAFGLLGLLDDLLAVTKGRNMGLMARQKLLGQLLFGLLLAYGGHRLGAGREMPLPFLTVTVTLGPTLFLLFSSFVAVAATNAVNLTDGLDGLAAGTVAAALLFQGYLAYLSGHPPLAAFAAAVAGSCLGFLWFNAHPAAVFMGDTGSLALGGALAAVAVLSGTTFFLPLTGGVFVLETLSVILQVLAFQTTGKRLFRMSPLHHHFELAGLSEEKVVVRFWLVGLLCGLLALFGAVPLMRA
ncbi:MAG: phospho-N-acetylmuramoyl-pentapeptide-transferase [Bacillota bacterium]